MFAPFTPVDKCIGKEIKARVNGEEYVGMLSGVYSTNGIPVMVLSPMNQGGTELHIPLPNAVVSVKHT